MSEEEQIGITIGEVVSEEEHIKERCNLVGRICTDRSIRRDTIQTTMRRIWRLHKVVSFKEDGKNLFIVTFSTEAKKQRVMARRPWLFDNYLFVLQSLDGRK